MKASIETFVECFRRALTLSGTPEGGTGWTLAKTGAGAVTGAGISGGGLRLSLDNTNEVQVASLFQNDVLPYPLAGLQHLWWIIEASSFGGNTLLAAGLGNARNDDTSAVTIRALAGVSNGGAADNKLIVNTADTVVTETNYDTGLVLAMDRPVKLAFDFTDGLAAVQLRIEDKHLVGKKFDLSSAFETSLFAPRCLPLHLRQGDRPASIKSIKETRHTPAGNDVIGAALAWPLHNPAVMGLKPFPATSAPR